MNKQNRFQSWVAVFTSIMDLTLLILTLTGTLKKMGLTEDSWHTIVGLIIVVATNVFAAFNNPINPNGL